MQSPDKLFRKRNLIISKTFWRTVSSKSSSLDSLLIHDENTKSKKRNVTSIIPLFIEILFKKVLIEGRALLRKMGLQHMSGMDLNSTGFDD
jgi:hypothetical protein